MKDGRAREAARWIVEAWSGGTRIDALPDSCRPHDLAEGYAAQAALVDATGDRVIGWKIAATAEAGQRHIGVDGPIAGRLFEKRVLRHPATVPFGVNHMAVAEAEFAFVLGNNLPPRDTPYSAAEAMAAVAALHPAIELPDSRYTDFAAVGAAQVAADDAFAHWFVLGDAVESDWRAVDLRAHAVTLAIDGPIVTRGTGADVLGDPRDALAWIANNHPDRGEGLLAGQIVTTGVCGKPSPIAPGDRVTADFGAFGRVEVRLSR